MDKPVTYQGFTDRARRASNKAREIARRFNRAEIEPEHLLLGLLEDRGSFAALLLNDCGVDLQHATLDVEALCQRGAAAVVKKRPWFSKSAKQIIELTLLEAKSLRQGCIGTEHLLLGCLLLGPETSSPVCMRLGVTVENVKEAIAQRYLREDDARFEVTESRRAPSKWLEVVTGTIALLGLAALVYGIIALVLGR